MKQILASEITVVKGLPPAAISGDVVALDTELYNMEKARLHRPTGQFASLACTLDGKTVYVIQDSSQVKEFLGNLKDATWIFQNALFDIFHLRRYTEVKKRMKLVDTMILDQIMFSGFYNDFSLSALARRWLGIYLPKAERESFIKETKMTDEMLQYACADVIATWRVYQAQRAAIDENDLNVWKNIDLPALWTVLAMSGMKLDTKAWIALAEKNEAKVKEISKKYEGINLGSWQQVLKQIHKLGYKKIENTQEDTIKGIADECEFVKDLLEWRGLNTAVTRYGKNWLEGTVEADGRVYSSFHVNGASSGRMSSSSPNFQNIPVKDTKEFRDCFVAGEGNVLIDADWSAQEPRIAAYLSGDSKLKEIFEQKKDIYIAAAKLMFDWDLTKKDPRRSKRMKPVVLGASYGLTEHGMKRKYDIPLEEGKELLRRFFDTFEGMRDWKHKQQKIHTYVTTIYGRKFWLNPYMQGSENNALNHPVQGSAADAMKIAAYRFLNEWGWRDTESVLVNVVHDEIILEVPESLRDAAMQKLKKVMIQVAEEMHSGIPCEIEIHASKSWGAAKE